LKSHRREEPRALVVSPAQRWLVAAFPTALRIYQCHPPWRLEECISPMLDTCTGEPSEWACCSFSPMAEVDHPGGNAGQDNHLAVFSAAVLCIVDYSGGWGEEAPRRSRSLMSSGIPTKLVYTACGAFLICGFQNGTLQIWNSASLMHIKTLNAHTESVLALSATPKDATYAPRFASCSSDQTLRVWHSAGWLLEQHIYDTHCDRGGVRKCMFSASGNWLLSVGSQLCVWRVNLTQKGKMVLMLHQRLSSVCGAEGLCTAAFSHRDAIAVGSRDGVLGLWTKITGSPSPEACAESPPSSPHKAVCVRTEIWGGESTSLARPMQKVTTGGPRLPRPSSTPGGSHQGFHLPLQLGEGGRGGAQALTAALASRLDNSAGEWNARSAKRNLGLSHLTSLTPPPSMAGTATARGIFGAGGSGRVSFAAGSFGSTGVPLSPGGQPTAGPAVMNPRAIVRTTTMPDLNRYRQARRADLAMANAGLDVARLGNSSTADLDYGESDSTVKKNKQLASRRGVVQRITLDAKVITDQKMEAEET